MRKQQGFLMIAALIIIVIFAILSATLVSMFVRTSIATAHLASTPNANFLAEGGLQQAQRNITEPIIANRQTCIGLSATGSLSTGSFTATRATDAANSINPRHAFSTLSTGISSVATPSTISVTSSAVLAPHGRVLIGREVFKYNRIANGTTLADVTRAQDGTPATAHEVGTIVSQYQCTIGSNGNSPASNPLSVREYQQGMQQPMLFTAGAGSTILRWNSASSELLWDDQSTGNFTFNGISALNYHDAWAVADRQNVNLSRFSRLQGNNWQNFTIGLPQSRDLESVHAVSANEAWAVGLLGQGNSFTILHWIRDGSNSNNNWCTLPCGGKTIDTSGTTNAQRELFSVKTMDTNADGYANIGFAVGGQDGTGGGNRGIVMAYNGTTWSNFSIPSQGGDRIGRLYGVDMSSATDAYFVGRTSQNNNNGRIIQYRNGVFTVINTPAIMRAVSCIDTDKDGSANFCAFVGDNGIAYTYDGANLSGPLTLTNTNLLGVAVLSPNDIWIVGAGGTRIRYNGTSIVSITANVSTANNLNAVTAVSPQLSPVSSWRDVMN